MPSKPPALHAAISSSSHTCLDVLNRPSSSIVQIPHSHLPSSAEKCINCHHPSSLPFQSHRSSLTMFCPTRIRDRSFTLLTAYSLSLSAYNVLSSPFYSSFPSAHILPFFNRQNISPPITFLPFAILSLILPSQMHVLKSDFVPTSSISAILIIVGTNPAKHIVSCDCSVFLVLFSELRADLPLNSEVVRLRGSEHYLGFVI